MAAPGKHYDEPPLEEAIFELFVAPSMPWTHDLVHQLTQRLPSYNGPQENLEDFNLFMQFGPGRAVSQGMQTGAQRTRLWNQASTRAVQFGIEMATHNVRRPYGHFEDHLSAIRELYEAYLDVTKPERLAWVGQRYLNVMRLPLDAAPSQFFEVYPRLPHGLPDEHRPFAVQVETAKFEHGSVVVNLALMEVSQGSRLATYTIDVYARSSDSVALEVGALMAWQERAHLYIGQSFEMTITDEARKLFKEMPWQR